MKIDDFGVVYYTNDEVCDLLYADPTISLDGIIVENPYLFNLTSKLLHAGYPRIISYFPPEGTVAAFDATNQSNWKMPDEYQKLDIAAWLLEKCVTEEELQRVGTELLMYQERNLFDMLRFMKYFVDTLRKHSILWGVGRGSSVASYVLFLIGAHRIDSIFYDLPIDEFLK